MLVVKRWKQKETKITSATRMKQDCRAERLTAQLGFACSLRPSPMRVHELCHRDLKSLEQLYLTQNSLLLDDYCNNTIQ